jgi:signal transduction histidine kinase
VSHELRTPLAVLRGSVDTLVRVGDRLDPDERNQLLAGASAHGDRLERMIEELLLVASAEQAASRVAVADVEMSSLLEEVVTATASISDGRVVALRRPLPSWIRTDHHKLRTVLIHLVENAAKFAPDGAIELEAVAAGNRALFYVTDRGPGIAPEHRERVFERFVQLDQSLTRTTGGLGLGLYLARQVAHLLGGEVVVTDAAGGGACFCLAIARELAPGRRTVVAGSSR